MPIRQGPIDLGNADAREQSLAIGRELRATRIGLGLSQAFVGRTSGTSRSRVGRIERGQLRSPPLDAVCRIARALGLAMSLRMYPAGSPARDAGQLGLIDRLVQVVARPLGLRREVGLPGRGELRAWDAAIVSEDGVAFIDAESRLGDVQALSRRLALKLRDDPRSTVVVLIVARTRHNAEVLRLHREALRDLLPLDGAAVARTLRAGRLPSASGLLVI